MSEAFCEEHHVKDYNCEVCGAHVVWIVKAIEVGAPLLCYAHRHENNKIILEKLMHPYLGIGEHD